MRATINRINEALSNEGIAAELVKGNGYFYFVGDAVDYAKEQGVYGVYRLSELSVEQWIAEARSRMVK